MRPANHGSAGGGGRAGGRAAALPGQTRPARSTPRPARAACRGARAPLAAMAAAGTLCGLPGWFHGPLSRREAEDLLDTSGATEGLFLVRTSSSEDSFVISLYCGVGKKHYQIRHVPENRWPELTWGGDRVAGWAGGAWRALGARRARAAAQQHSCTRPPLTLRDCRHNKNEKEGREREREKRERRKAQAFFLLSDPVCFIESLRTRTHNSSTPCIFFFFFSSSLLLLLFIIIIIIIIIIIFLYVHFLCRSLVTVDCKIRANTPRPQFSSLAGVVHYVMNKPRAFASPCVTWVPRRDPPGASPQNTVLIHSGIPVYSSVLVCQREGVDTSFCFLVKKCCPFLPTTTATGVHQRHGGAAARIAGQCAASSHAAAGSDHQPRANHGGANGPGLFARRPGSQHRPQHPPPP